MKSMFMYPSEWRESYCKEYIVFEIKLYMQICPFSNFILSLKQLVRYNLQVNSISFERRIFKIFSEKQKF